MASLKRNKIYYFHYNPKLKEKLPFWDRRPLVFPLRQRGSHTLGVNFHWIPRGSRRKFLDFLLVRSKQIKNDKNFSRLAYETLKSDPRMRPVIDKAIRLYINNRISNVKEITREEVKEIDLPGRKLFRKYPAKKVYK